MGWVVPNNFVPDKLFTPIIKRVRELSFPSYSYYCSPTRKDTDLKTTVSMTFLSIQSSLNFVLQ